MKLSRPLGVVLLFGLAFIPQGCLVMKSQYDRLRAERDQLRGSLDEKDKEIDAQKETFLKRSEDVNRELELLRSQAGASQTELEKLRKASEGQRKSIEDDVRALKIGEVREGRLILQDSVLFKRGEAALTRQGQDSLDKIARAFKSKDVIIEIDGHADSSRIEKQKTKQLHVDNMGLSANRALSVFRYLAKEGIPERHLYIRAFGAARPVEKGSTEVAMARNRRVEILFLPSSKVPMPKHAAPSPEEGAKKHTGPAPKTPAPKTPAK